MLPRRFPLLLAACLSPTLLGTCLAVALAFAEPEASPDEQALSAAAAHASSASKSRALRQAAEVRAAAKQASPDAEITSIRALAADSRRVRVAAAATPPPGPLPPASDPAPAPPPPPPPQPPEDGLEAIICSYPWPCEEAIAVARCESGADMAGRLDGNWARSSTGLGLFQINAVHAWRWADFWDAWMDPQKNTAWAYEIWLEWGGWSPWTCRPW